MASSSTINESTEVGYYNPSEYHPRTEAQDLNGDRSGRRQRIPGTTRNNEGGLVPEVLGRDGGTSRGRLRTNWRAAECFASQNLRAQSCPLRRFRHLRTLWKEAAAIFEIQGADPDTTRLCYEGDSRPRQLHGLEGLLPSVQDCDDHDGRDQCSEPHGVRGLCGTFSPDLSYGLAFGGPRRRQCESRTLDSLEDEIDDHIICRRGSTYEMGSKKAVGLPFLAFDGGREVLERAGTHPGDSLDGIGSSWHTKVPCREVSPQLHEGWPRGNGSTYGEERKKRFQGEQEEEEEELLRQRRRFPKGKLWRIPRRRNQIKGKRKERKRTATLLCLERQHGKLCRSQCRSRVQSTGEAGASVHQVQISRPPGIRMPHEEMTTWRTWWVAWTTSAWERKFKLCLKAAARDSGPVKKAVEVKKEMWTRREGLVPEGHEGEREKKHKVDLVVARAAFAVATHWMLREIELSNLQRKDVIFDVTKRRVTLSWAKSKTDTEAKGTCRVLQCTCGENACEFNCPYEATWRLVHGGGQATTSQYVGEGYALKTLQGKKVRKCDIVAAWKHLFGEDVTGHSPRRTGALQYIREGWTVSQVAFLGRWKSQVIYEYAKGSHGDSPRECMQHLRGRRQEARWYGRER